MEAQRACATLTAPKPGASCCQHAPPIPSCRDPKCGRPKSSRNGTWSAGACGHHPLRALCGQQQAHSCQRQDARDQSARPRRRRPAPWTSKYVQIWTTAVAAVLAIRAPDWIYAASLPRGRVSSLSLHCPWDLAGQDLGFAQFCVWGGARALFLDRFSSPREGQIPDRFRQVWTGFRKNLPEPVRVPYLTKPGPNLTEGYPSFSTGAARAALREGKQRPVIAKRPPL